MSKHSVTEIIGDKVKKKRTRTYFWINGVLLNNTDLDYTTNFLDFTEVTEWICKEKNKTTKVHYSWITDLDLSKENVEEIAQGGRTRWRIENEVFNTLKNRGFNFEHNYGHGYQYLSNLLATLMVLAFLFDQLQELGCKLFKRARIAKNRKLYLIEYIISCITMAQFSSWKHLISFIAYPDAYVIKPAPA